MASANEFDELARLFPGGPHRHALGLRALDAAAYFGRADAELVIAERRRLLDENAARWLAAEPGHEALAQAAVEFAAPFLRPDGAVDPLLKLARGLAPDFVLLAAGSDELRAVAGCVCLPSGWSFPAKLGKPLAEIHAVVPELNRELGRKIDTFLRRLEPGQGYARENWGLSSSPAWSQDPAAGIPAPGGDPAGLFFRVERQALVGLPGQGVLFLIDLHVYPLAAAVGSVAFRAGLTHALRAMPEAMASYKRLANCREEVARWLES